MLRKIIEIDEYLCDGCGICATACHEGAIAIIDGKAKLIRDDYCDGFGDCLPACHTGAIKFVEREALAYDEEAVKENLRKKESMHNHHKEGMSCPGSRMKDLSNKRVEEESVVEANVLARKSELNQWPCQIKLAPINAPFFNKAKLLIAADCAAYAYANMHNDFMKGKITLIGCPKLDDIDYSDKLTEIIRSNDIESVTVVKMEVPCCGGLEMATKKALQASGKFIPWQIVTLSLDGRILD